MALLFLFDDSKKLKLKNLTYLSKIKKIKLKASGVVSA